jgi:hypothetical protein
MVQPPPGQAPPPQQAPGAESCTTYPNLLELMWTHRLDDDPYPQQSNPNPAITPLLSHSCKYLVSILHELETQGTLAGGNVLYSDEPETLNANETLKGDGPWVLCRSQVQSASANLRLLAYHLNLRGCSVAFRVYVRNTGTEEVSLGIPRHAVRHGPMGNYTKRQADMCAQVVEDRYGSEATSAVVPAASAAHILEWSASDAELSSLILDIEGWTGSSGIQVYVVAGLASEPAWPTGDVAGWLQAEANYACFREQPARHRRGDSAGIRVVDWALQYELPVPPAPGEPTPPPTPPGGFRLAAESPAIVDDADDVQGSQCTAEPGDIAPAENKGWYGTLHRMHFTVVNPAGAPDGWVTILCNPRASVEGEGAQQIGTCFGACCKVSADWPTPFEVHKHFTITDLYSQKRKWAFAVVLGIGAITADTAVHIDVEYLQPGFDSMPAHFVIVGDNRVEGIPEQ